MASKYASNWLRNKFDALIIDDYDELFKLYGLTDTPSQELDKLYIALPTTWYTEATNTTDILYNSTENKYYINGEYFSDNTQSNRWFTLDDLLNRVYNSTGTWQPISLSPSNIDGHVVDSTNYPVNSYSYFDPHDSTQKYLIQPMYVYSDFHWLTEQEMNLRGYFIDQFYIPLNFTAVNDNTYISLNIEGDLGYVFCEYAINNTDTWNDYTFGQPILLYSGDKVYFRGMTCDGTQSQYNHVYFASNNFVYANGNINSILADESFTSIDSNSSYGDYVHYGLFSDMQFLLTAPLLPDVYVGQYHYAHMFENCINLTKPPKLQLTELNDNCYNSMFKGCTSLSDMPYLPSTTIQVSCYESMFEGCVSLTKTTSLDSKFLFTDAYKNMFKDCTSLKEVHCYTVDTYIEYIENWLLNVADTGDFYTDDSTDWTINSPSGIPTGWRRVKVIGKSSTVSPNTIKLQSDYWWAYDYNSYARNTLFGPEHYSSSIDELVPNISDTTGDTNIGDDNIISYVELHTPVSDILTVEYSSDNGNINEINISKLDDGLSFAFPNASVQTNFDSVLVGKYGSSASTYSLKNDLPDDLYTLSDGTSVIWNTTHPLYSILYGKCFTEYIDVPVPTDGLVIGGTIAVNSDGITEFKTGSISDVLNISIDLYETTLPNLPNDIASIDIALLDSDWSSNIGLLSLPAIDPEPDKPISDLLTLNLNDQWKYASEVDSYDSQVFSQIDKTQYAVVKSFSNHNLGNTTATMYITCDLPKSVTFNFKIANWAEGNGYDYPKILLDGNDLYDHHYNSDNTGIVTNVQITIPQGEHTLTILYRKDSSVDKEPDCAYLLIPTFPNRSDL